MRSAIHGHYENPNAFKEAAASYLANGDVFHSLLQGSYPDAPVRNGGLFMDEKEVLELITKAITSSNYKWRTPQGIAKDSGVPLGQVIQTLEKSNDFVRASNANSTGEPLYSTREKYTNTSSIGQRIISAITNKISE